MNSYKLSDIVRIDVFFWIAHCKQQVFPNLLRSCEADLRTRPRLGGTSEMGQNRSFARSATDLGSPNIKASLWCASGTLRSAPRPKNGYNGLSGVTICVRKSPTSSRPRPRGPPLLTTQRVRRYSAGGMEVCARTTD